MTFALPRLTLMTCDNPKILKGMAQGYLSAILHLAPARLSGYNVCPMASKGCAAGCLNTSGRGAMSKTQNARIRRTLMYFNDRPYFMRTLASDLAILRAVAMRENMRPVVRLNGTSDIRWENEPVMFDGTEYPNLMALYPDMIFTDYTKLPNRRNLPANYYLTFSRSESNAKHIETAMANGMNVAVVFRTKPYPATYLGRPVIDGDVNDLRFLDPKGCIVGLYAKGRAKKDATGFVADAA